MNKIIIACIVSTGVALCALALGIALGAGWSGTSPQPVTADAPPSESNVDLLAVRAIIREELQTGQCNETARRAAPQRVASVNPPR